MVYLQSLFELLVDRVYKLLIKFWHVQPRHQDCAIEPILEDVNYLLRTIILLYTNFPFVGRRVHREIIVVVILVLSYCRRE